MSGRRLILRTIFVILVVAGMAVANAVVVTRILSAKAGATADTTTAVVDGVNKVREDQGLTPLKSNQRLTTAAETKVKNMCDNNYFTHNDKQGHRFFYYILQAGYNYDSAGENLAQGYNTIQGAVNAWVASPSHYANIINASYTETGVAVLQCSNYQDSQESTVIVQLFGKPYTVAQEKEPQAPVVAEHRQSSLYQAIALASSIVALAAFTFILTLVFSRRK